MFLPQEHTNDIHEGIKKVEDGSAYGFLHIPVNYSQNFVERYVHDITPMRYSHVHFNTLMQIILWTIDKILKYSEITLYQL